ncbi:Calcineurin-like phosphoesterase [uncultured archaeon]|nr:Calcineurin-like phosphoesterase [uncultured archaeon]
MGAMLKIYDLEVVDRCLYWKSEKTLIVGDLHLGYEDTLTESGYALPRTQQKENYEIFERIFNKLDKKIERIILLGDVKHFFGKILRQELIDFEELVKFFEKKIGKRVKIIVTKGNHDKILEPLIIKYTNIELKDYFLEKGVLFLHGDAESMKKAYFEIQDKRTKLIVLGHFHPALVLQDKKGVKVEKYKCFLYGFSPEYKREVVFVPSFFPLIEGSDIKQELEIYNKSMKVIAVTDEGELYKFEKL